MTKRFTYEYDEYSGNLFDNKMNTFYHIEDSDENIEVLCDRLNWLVEENEELKSKNRGLQSELQIFKEDVTHSNLQINKLTDENKQLRTKSNAYLQDIEVYREENEQLKQFQEQVAEIIESKMGNNVCNDYKMEVLKEIWNELKLDEVWFE